VLLLLFISGAAAIASAASPVAWRVAAPSGAALEVYADDSYALLAPGGAAWLASAPTAVHVGGAWFASASASASATAAANCSRLQDVDCRGDDLFFFNSTDPQECCANCSATPGCGAWTWTGVTAAAAPPAWANRCYIKADCADHQSYAGHVSGVAPPAPPLPLTRLGAGPSDGGGGYEVRYSANGTLLTTSFAMDAASGAFIFTQSFPQGAAGGVAILTPTNATGKAGVVDPAAARRPPPRLGEFASSGKPATQFPVFVAGNASSELGFVSWAGRFFQSFGSGGGGADAALAAAAGGAEGGPIVLFAPGAQGLAAVLSPLDNFKSSMLGAAQFAAGGAAAGGVSGYVTSLPVNFSTSTVVLFGAAGVTDAVHQWGAALLARHGGAPKFADPASEQLTYWTDNGAYYDFYAYEPDITSHGVPQDILEALAETFRNGTYPGPPIPVKMLMLDAYWMYNVRANGNCKLNDSSWPLPFPRGLPSLSAATGLPLILYNGPQCGNSSYATDYPLVDSLYWDQGWGAGVLSAVAGASARAFYDALFARLAAEQAMGSFTQDFLDFQGLLFPAFLEDAVGNGAWMAGQADAAQAAGIAVQYCMALPADILFSATSRAVTNARASDDYGVGSESSWHIARSSLLLSAVNMRASKDNFATGAATDRGQETSPFLSAAVCALSGGPVGFSDALFKTNAAVLWPTTTSNGTLLHASRPATALDQQFAGAGPLAAGDVRAAHSAVDGGGLGPLLFYSVLAAEAAPGAVRESLAAADLWPLATNPVPDPSGVNWFMWEYGNPACSTDGADAEDCVSIFMDPAANVPLPAPRSSDAVAWELWNLTPLHGGSTLLGEVGKFVAVSPARFKRVDSSAGNGLVVSLAGAPAENVTISWIMRSDGLLGSVHVATYTLGEDGALTTTLKS
jgi:hypothetical protein